MTKHRPRNPAAGLPHVAAAPDVDPDDSASTNAFEREMANVVRLPADPRGRVSARPTTVLSRAKSSTERPGNSEPTEESGLDFAAPGVDRREIRKLKRGAYIVASRRDLHGMSADAACASVRRFIDSSRHGRHRCVCIVHGRGLHSVPKTSVVKARVREYLRTHPLVLAYADAPRSDGGAGAMYVLLRSK